MEVFTFVSKLNEQVLVFIATSGLVRLVDDEAEHDLFNSDDPMPQERITWLRNIDWGRPHNAPMEQVRGERIERKEAISEETR